MKQLLEGKKERSLEWSGCCKCGRKCLSPSFPNTGTGNKIYMLIGKTNKVKFPNSNQFCLLEHFVGDFLVYILTHEFSCSHSSYFFLWERESDGFMGTEANLPWISATDLCCGPKYQLAHPLAELQCFHHPGKEPSELLQQLALIGGENSNILKSKGSFHK